MLSRLKTLQQLVSYVMPYVGTKWDNKLTITYKCGTETQECTMVIEDVLILHAVALPVTDMIHLEVSIHGEFMEDEVRVEKKEINTIMSSLFHS